MKNKNLNCKECGNDEFITEPNKYDIYKANEGKLEFQKAEIIQETIKLYCRECSEELALVILSNEDSALFLRFYFE